MTVARYSLQVLSNSELHSTYNLIRKGPRPSKCELGKRQLLPKMKSYGKQFVYWDWKSKKNSSDSYYHFKSELTFQDTILFKRTRMMIPKMLQRIH